MTPITYYDRRRSDTYVTETTADGAFLICKRYLAGTGRDPIVYERLEDIPAPHQSAIQKLIRKGKEKEAELKNLKLLACD